MRLYFALIAITTLSACGSLKSEPVPQTGTHPSFSQPASSPRLTPSDRFLGSKVDDLKTGTVSIKLTKDLSGMLSVDHASIQNGQVVLETQSELTSCSFKDARATLKLTPGTTLKFEPSETVGHWSRDLVPAFVLSNQSGSGVPAPCYKTTGALGAAESVELEGSVVTTFKSKTADLTMLCQIKGPITVSADALKDEHSDNNPGFMYVKNIRAAFFGSADVLANPSDN